MRARQIDPVQRATRGGKGPPENVCGTSRNVYTPNGRIRPTPQFVNSSAAPVSGACKSPNQDESFSLNSSTTRHAGDCPARARRRCSGRCGRAEVRGSRPGSNRTMRPGRQFGGAGRPCSPGSHAVHRSWRARSSICVWPGLRAQEGLRGVVPRGVVCHRFAPWDRFKFCPRYQRRTRSRHGQEPHRERVLLLSAALTGGPCAPPS
jgi:hypothetical protein